MQCKLSVGVNGSYIYKITCPYECVRRIIYKTFKSDNYMLLAPKILEGVPLQGFSLNLTEQGTMERSWAHKITEMYYALQYQKQGL